MKDSVVNKITSVEKISLFTIKYINSLKNVSGWKEFSRKKLAYTLNFDDESTPLQQYPESFHFDERTEKEHNVLMCYLELESCLQSFKNCEYYFRRFPFRGLPITHSEYLTNNCELVFNKIYEFRERIKKLGKAIELLNPAKHLDTGNLIKTFDKHFKPEIIERNLIHHHSRFSDVTLSKIMLISTLENNQPNKYTLATSLNVEYRKICREWIIRIRERSSIIDSYLENIAQSMFECCNFLDKDFPAED